MICRFRGRTWASSVDHTAKKRLISVSRSGLLSFPPSGMELSDLTTHIRHAYHTARSGRAEAGAVFPTAVGDWHFPLTAHATGRPVIAAANFDFLDTSGEPRESKEHQGRLSSCLLSRTSEINALTESGLYARRARIYHIGEDTCCVGLLYPCRGCQPWPPPCCHSGWSISVAQLITRNGFHRRLYRRTSGYQATPSETSTGRGDSS